MSAYLLYQAVDYEGEWFQDGRELSSDKAALAWVEAILAEGVAVPEWGRYADQITLKRVTQSRYSNRLTLEHVAAWTPDGWGENRTWEPKEDQ